MSAPAWRRRLYLALALAAPVLPATAEDAAGRIALKTSTSACIGEPASPVCAALTLLACFARAERELCRRVGVADPGVPAAPALIEYVIERVSVIRPEDVTEDLRDLEWFRPGYALIEILRRSCPAEQESCAQERWEEAQIYARPLGDGPAGGRWKIVTWRGDGEPDTAPEIPEALPRVPPQR
ncbi:MAG: hypothetical protein ACT4P2_02140 [Pseudomonadota bacterium]